MVNGKIGAIFDLVWRILILNLMSVIITVGTFGVLFVPSIVAMYKTFKKLDDNNGENIFKMYFKGFIDDWKKLLILTVIFDLLVIIYAYNVILYMENIELDPSSSFVYVLFISTLFVVFLCVAIFIHIPLVLTYFKLNTWHTIKMSIYMSGRYFATTGIGMVLLVISVLMALRLTAVWVFIGMSVPVFLIYKFSRNTYNYLSSNINDVSKADQYDFEKEEEE